MFRKILFGAAVAALSAGIATSAVRVKLASPPVAIAASSWGLDIPQIERDASYEGMPSFDSLSEALDHFEPVIGLEVHAQLKTKTKLFSGAPASFRPDEPNTNITAYCLGLPGVLPVLNEEAVTMAVRAGLALERTADRHAVHPELHR